MAQRKDRGWHVAAAAGGLMVLLSGAAWAQAARTDAAGAGVRGYLVAGHPITAVAPLPEVRR